MIFHIWLFHGGFVMDAAELILVIIMIKRTREDDSCVCVCKEALCGLKRDAIRSDVAPNGLRCLHVAFSTL